MSKQKGSLQIQRLIVVIALLLFLLKLWAWYLTQSLAILTDALESTVNVVSAFLGLYSLYLSAQEADENHPYGHGKVEYISAGIEGALISLAGLYIIVEASQSFFLKSSISSLDIGIYLIALTGFINYGIGFYAEKKATENNSIALLASAKHLKSDAITSVGIITGLLVLFITDLAWIDSLLAILFAVVIIVSGIKIIRQSIAGIMDEADEQLLQKILDILKEKRNENWIDIHNFRIIHYGNLIHIDCHITLPFYWTVRQSQEEINKIHQVLTSNFDEHIELFVLSEACEERLCINCLKEDCEARQEEFREKKTWTLEHIRKDFIHN